MEQEVKDIRWQMRAIADRVNKKITTMEQILTDIEKAAQKGEYELHIPKYKIEVDFNIHHKLLDLGFSTESDVWFGEDTCILIMW